MEFRAFQGNHQIPEESPAASDEESEKMFVGTLSQDKKRWIIKAHSVQVGKDPISTYDALFCFDLIGQGSDQTSIVSMKPWSLSNDERRLGGKSSP